METGKDGELLCPLTFAEMQWDEIGDVQSRVVSPCRSPLHLERLYDYPLYAEGPGSDDFGPKDWCTSAWSVGCENGHILLKSAGEETAEDFEKRFLEEMEGTHV